MSYEEARQILTKRYTLKQERMFLEMLAHDYLNDRSIGRTALTCLGCALGTAVLGMIGNQYGSPLLGECIRNASIVGTGFLGLYPLASILDERKNLQALIEKKLSLSEVMRTGNLINIESTVSRE